MQPQELVADRRTRQTLSMDTLPSPFQSARHKVLPVSRLSMGLSSGVHRSAAAPVDRLPDRQVPAEGTSAAASHASEDGHSPAQPCHRRPSHSCSDALAPGLLL